jgi:hypothetical protein
MEMSNYQMGSYSTRRSHPGSPAQNVILITGALNYYTGIFMTLGNADTAMEILHQLMSSAMGLRYRVNILGNLQIVSPAIRVSTL